MSAERPIKNFVPPEMRGVIAQMENIMNIPEFNNVQVPSEFVFKFWQGDYIDSPAQFEQYLRAMGSRVHLFAAPLEAYGENNPYGIKYPEGKRQDEPQYALYVAVEGTKHAEEVRKALNVSREENLKRLKNTGFLYTKK